MLVLGRKAGESIILNGVITITILSIEGNRARVGIQAPLDVSAVREELIPGTDAFNAKFPAFEMLELEGE